LFAFLADSLLWILFVLALAGGWWMNLLGLPGNWIIVGIAAATAWLAPEHFRLSMSPTIVYVLVGLALLGEGVEFLAGALGVKRAGGSRRGAIYSLGGGLAGASSACSSACRSRSSARQSPRFCAPAWARWQAP